MNSVSFFFYVTSIAFRINIPKEIIIIKLPQNGLFSCQCGIKKRPQANVYLNVV